MNARLGMISLRRLVAPAGLSTAPIARRLACALLRVSISVRRSAASDRAPERLSELLRVPEANHSRTVLPPKMIPSPK